MSYNQKNLALDIEENFKTDLTKAEKKKKINDLLDKYGSVEALNRYGNLKDTVEYMFAEGDKYIDEVEKDRRLAAEAKRSDVDTPLRLASPSATRPRSPRIENSSLNNEDEEDIDYEEEEEEEEVEEEKIPSLTPKQKEEALSLKPLANTNMVKKYADNEHIGEQSDEVEKNTSLTPVDRYLNNSFFDKLGMLESSNDYKKQLKGKGIGAIGKYQMRGLGLIDLGYLDKNYNWTGKKGIHSIEEFIQNENLQEQVVREYSNLNYKYLKHRGALSYVGIKINGKVADFKITISGLIAAAHKEGVGGVNKYLRLLEKDNKGSYYLPYHKYNGDTLRSLLAIETRLRTFSEFGKN